MKWAAVCPLGVGQVQMTDETQGRAATIGFLLSNQLAIIYSLGIPITWIILLVRVIDSHASVPMKVFEIVIVNGFVATLWPVPLVWSTIKWVAGF